MARVIVFGPHPDDQEIGMGGTISLLAAHGHDVLIADVTDGSPTPRGDRASRLPEAAAALGALQPDPAAPGARPIRRILLDLPNRTVEHTLAARRALAGAIRAWQAEIVFTPWPEDAHPDHRAVTRSVEDARFDAKLTRVDMPTPPAPPGQYGGAPLTVGPPIYPRWLFYYHVSHLRAPVAPHFIIDISGHEQKKLAAIKAYRSQFGPWDDAPGFSPGDPKHAPGTRGRLVTPDLPDRILQYSAYMGSLIGSAYGEPFMTREPLGLSGLGALLL